MYILRLLNQSFNRNNAGALWPQINRCFKTIRRTAKYPGVGIAASSRTFGETSIYNALQRDGNIGPPGIHCISAISSGAFVLVTNMIGRTSTSRESQLPGVVIGESNEQTIRRISQPIAARSSGENRNLIFVSNDREPI